MKGIYAYVDTMDNSVVYVGRDVHIDKNKRHQAHLQKSRYDAQPFNRIIQNNPNRYEYKQVFVFDEISDKELNQLEMEQIALFNPKFNFTKGGGGVRGYKFSDECRRRISEALKGREVSLETRQKIGEAHRGKTVSEETRKKMSENNARYWKGKKHSEEHRRKMSENSARYWKGKTMSIEHRKKLSMVRNTSGYYRVCKHKDERHKQGFRWTYQYYEDGKRKELASVDLKKLEEKVKAKGLEWYKLEEVEE